MEVPNEVVYGVYILVGVPLGLIAIGCLSYIVFDYFTWGRRLGKWIVNKFTNKSKEKVD